MGKSSRDKTSRRSAAARPSAGSTGSTDTAVLDDVPVVGQREPCPCGSGLRYKACHGRARAAAPARHVARPFARLPGEVDWVAMREIVPAATATVRLRADADLPTSEHGAAPAEVTVATVLPMAWPALRRADGAIFLGLQNSGGGSGDPSRDVGGALTLAAQAEPGTPVTAVGAPGPRLQDLVDTGAPFEVTVHPGFDFWVDGAAELTLDVKTSLERANASVVPTARLTGVEGAYWAQVGDRVHLRWVLPQEEDALLDAIARLHAAGASGLGEGTRYIGAFRTHGLLVPVWDLAPGTSSDDVEEPASAFARRLDEALQVTTPLTYDERRARAGVVSRQLTLR